MSVEEHAQLRRIMGSPGVVASRGLGLLMSLGALGLTITYLAGVPYDMSVFPEEVLIVGFIGAIAGVAASTTVRDPRTAINRGEIIDVSGSVAPTPNALFGSVGFQIGPLTLMMPRARSSELAPGQVQRVAVATGLPAVGNKRGVGPVPDRGLLLSVNGVPLRRPPAVFYQLTPGPVDLPPLLMPTTGSALPSAPTAAVGDTPFCDRCGQRNAAGFLFCARCGAPRSQPH
jgi:hypothetical protein